LRKTLCASDAAKASMLKSMLHDMHELTVKRKLFYE
jgi:hypothetical protein